MVYTIQARREDSSDRRDSRFVGCFHPERKHNKQQQQQQQQPQQQQHIEQENEAPREEGAEV